MFLELQELMFSFSGIILNSSESSRIYFSASVSILLITNLEEGSYFVTNISTGL